MNLLLWVFITAIHTQQCPDPLDRSIATIKYETGYQSGCCFDEILLGKYNNLMRYVCCYEYTYNGPVKYCTGHVASPSTNYVVGLFKFLRKGLIAITVQQCPSPVDRLGSTTGYGTGYQTGCCFNETILDEYNQTIYLACCYEYVSEGTYKYCFDWDTRERVSKNNMVRNFLLVLISIMCISCVAFMIYTVVWHK